MKNLILLNRLGFNPNLTTRQSRVDSVSNPCRCRVLATLLLCLTLFVGSGNAWGAYTYSGTGTFNKQSTIDGDGYYVIIFTNSGAMTNNSPASNYVGVNTGYNGTSSNTISDPATSVVLQVTNYDSTNKKYYINNNSGNYLYSSGDKKIAYSATAQYWEIATVSSKVRLKTAQATVVYMGYYSGSGFRPYENSGSNVQSVSAIYKLAASCDKNVTITKGTPESGGSFDLDKTGSQATCSGLTVTVSNIVAPSGKKFSAITQTGVASGVTIDQSAKTVTYAANTTGSTSTINVTYEDKGCVDHAGDNAQSYIGTGYTYGPVDAYYEYNTRQILYTKADLGLAAGKKGVIKSIYFRYAYGTAMSSKTSVKIYMANTSLAALSTSNYVTSFTEVYSGALNGSGNGTWNEIILDSPFNYDGIGNLVVVIDDNSNAYDGTNYVYSYHTASTTSGAQLYTRSASSDADPTAAATWTGATLVNYRPATKFCIQEADMTPATVTLMDNGATITELSAGEGVTLPSRTGCDGYTFAGWTKSWTEEQDEWTTTAPDIIEAGSYTPSSNENLYPVYTKTEGGGDGFKLSLEYNSTEYYIAPRSGSNAYLGATTNAAEAEIFYIEDDDLYYLDGETKTYVNSNTNTTSLTFVTSAPVGWTITNSDGVWTFQSKGTGTRHLAWNYNSGSPRFSSYTGSSTYLYQYTKHSLSTTSYISVPKCCDNIVELSVGSLSHCSSMSIDNTDLATCSSTDADRQVTITVTPDAGYEMTSEARLTFTPTDGDPYPTATYVSGPTPVGATYQFVYEFKKDDDGDGTFTATCTPKAISLVLDKNNSDVSGSADGSATVYFDATSLSTISHATRSGYVLDGYYAEQECTNKVLTDAGALVNYTGYVVSGKWARATTPTTLYAKWIAKSFEDYKFTCAELTLTPHLVTDGTPIFITSTASKKVRSQDSIQITGSGLTPNTTLTFPGLPAKFEIKTATYGALSTDASGAIDVAAYIFYTPDAGSTTDGLDEIASITASVGGAKAKQVSLVQSIIGRHIATDFVIAAKNTNNNKWYALPANMSSECTPAPVEIAVDDIDNPSIAYTANTNIYNLYGQSSGAGYLEEAGQYVKLGMKNNSNYPLFGYAGDKSSLKGDPGATVTNNIGNDYWWLLTQTNTSIANPQDAKYTIGSGNNAKTLSAWFNATPQKWGLFAAGNGEHTLRLIPASSVVPTEAEVVEWGLHAAIVEVNAQGVSATKVKAKLNGATSSLITLATTGTSVKGTATKYDYTVSFGDGIDFAANSGKMLTLEWYNSSDVMVAVSNILVPKIIASSASMSSIESGDTPWSKWEVHVLPGVTLTANAGSFTSSDVTIKQLEIYQGATVNVTTGTLDVTKLVLRNGWRRVNGKAYEVARLYITPTNGNLTVTNAYADWYIDFDQYYPIAVPWDVTVSNISYKNSNTTATIDGTSGTLRLRYYDGASRATNVQEGVSSGANWKAYGADGCRAVPAKLVPSVGYAMTAKRPTGKAFSIIRMPLTIPSSSWTAGGEQGYISSTHKDQVSITAYGSEETPEYAKGWNLIANPYMSLYQGTIEYAGGDKVNYVNIPDVDFKDYSQMPTALTKLKPASAFLVQAPSTGTVTFGSTNRKASAPGYRNNMKEEIVPEQQAYININDESSSDMMGLWIADKYTAAYNANADLEKLLGEGTSLKTYMHFGDMDMAYLAINETLAKEWIPVLVRIPENGEYTFSLHDASTVDRLAGVYLIDHGNGDQVTNLITDNYTFFSTSGTISGRFAINATVGERMPTDVDVVNADEKNSSAPVKFIFHEKVYIMYNGVIYDATGKRVMEINK